MSLHDLKCPEQTPTDTEHRSVLGLGGRQAAPKQPGPCGF